MKKFFSYLTFSLLAGVAALKAGGTFNVENAEKPHIQTKKMKFRKKLETASEGKELEFTQRKLNILQTASPDDENLNNNNMASYSAQYKQLKKEELSWKKEAGKFIPRFDFENLSMEVFGNNVHLLLDKSQTLEGQGTGFTLNPGQGILWKNGKFEIVEKGPFLTIDNDKKNIHFEIYKSENVIQITKSIGVKYFGLNTNCLVRYPGQYEMLERFSLRAPHFINNGTLKVKSFQFDGDTLENNGYIISDNPIVIGSNNATVNNNNLIMAPGFISNEMIYNGSPVVPVRDFDEAFFVDKDENAPPPPPRMDEDEELKESKVGEDTPPPPPLRDFDEDFFIDKDENAPPPPPPADEDEEVKEEKVAEETPPPSPPLSSKKVQPEENVVEQGNDSLAAQLSAVKLKKAEPKSFQKTKAVDSLAEKLAEQRRLTHPDEDEDISDDEEEIVVSTPKIQSVVKIDESPEGKVKALNGVLYPKEESLRELNAELARKATAGKDTEKLDEKVNNLVQEVKALREQKVKLLHEVIADLKKEKDGIEKKLKDEKRTVRYIVKQTNPLANKISEYGRALQNLEENLAEKSYEQKVADAVESETNLNLFIKKARAKQDNKPLEQAENDDDAWN